MSRWPAVHAGLTPKRAGASGFIAVAHGQHRRRCAPASGYLARRARGSSGTEAGGHAGSRFSCAADLIPGQMPCSWGAWERPHETRHASSVALGRWALVFVYSVNFVVPTLRGVEAPRMASLHAPSAAGRRPRPRMQPVRTSGFVEPRNTRTTRKRGPSRSCGPCPWAGAFESRWIAVHLTRR